MTPLLRVADVTKQFGGFSALSRVSFEVAEGEILGLIGPNGSGKTTMFNCISGALPPTSGSIQFRGEEMAGRTPDAICHRGIARTFQIPRPFREALDRRERRGGAISGRHPAASTRPARGPARCWPWWGCRRTTAASTTPLGAGGLKKLELARALATGPKLLSPTRAWAASTPTRWRAPPRC
jgi:branched-chain amino acid transport system ATP-binding protein